MATDTLQSESRSATPKLAQELEGLYDRVRRMERLLCGAESILSSIRYDGEICFTPADDSHTDRHRRAYYMIEFLSEQLESWRETESDLDFPSDGLWNLLDGQKSNLREQQS